MNNDARMLDDCPLYRNFSMPVFCAQKAGAGNDGRACCAGERALAARGCVVAATPRVFDAKGMALCNDGLRGCTYA